MSSWRQTSKHQTLRVALRSRSDPRSSRHGQSRALVEQLDPGRSLHGHPSLKQLTRDAQTSSSAASTTERSPGSYHFNERLASLWLHCEHNRDSSPLNESRGAWLIEDRQCGRAHLRAGAFICRLQGRSYTRHFILPCGLEAGFESDLTAKGEAHESCSCQWEMPFEGGLLSNFSSP